MFHWCESKIFLTDGVGNAQTATFQLVDILSSQSLEISLGGEGKRRLPAGIPGEASGTVLGGENVALQRRAHTRESPRHRERQYNDAA